MWTLLRGIRWLLTRSVRHRALPELAGLSHAQSDRAWFDFQREARQRIGYWGYWLAALAWGASLLFGVQLMILIRAYVPGNWGSVLSLLALSLVLGLISDRAREWVHYWTMRPLLRSKLPDHCKLCGYDLRGNRSGRCPECGAEGVTTELAAERLERLR